MSLFPDEPQLHPVIVDKKQSTRGDGLYCHVCHRYWGRKCIVTIERENGFVVAKEPLALCDECVKERHRLLAVVKR